MAKNEVFNIEFEGYEKLIQSLGVIEKELDLIIKQATQEGALVVVREAKLNSEKGGLITKKGYGSYSNIGGQDFPHRITGNLMRSIKILKTYRTLQGWEVILGSSMIYAARLEYGFNDVDKKGRRFHQKPRPYLRPALDEHKLEIIRAFQLTVKSYLKG
jgi:hypothetical protein